MYMLGSTAVKCGQFTINQFGGMTGIMSLHSEVGRLCRDSTRIANKRWMSGELTMFRYEFVHDDEAEFVAYQMQLAGGVWQTLSSWMIPHPLCRN
jgi:hypothetical protein